MAGDRDKKAQEREKLKNLIAQWNANRLDIFWLTEPNEDLEFHGAMRFYFQDAGQKVATKCIRVSSTAQTADVIRTLIEKFRPDIRMLSIPEYAIYEIHENGEERKLDDTERPLLVQLDWHKDDREGRFLLRRMAEKSYISSMDAYDNDNFKRKLSKREKKEKKRREKKERLKAAEESKKDGIAERLYSELPETSFTRSISNPEAVMRRRRQQILEKKLQQFCQEGGTDAGGTLRIFGESLNKDVPYKTLLLSMKDTAAYVVKEILSKYGYEKEDPALYCLVQVIIPHHTPNEDIHNMQGNTGVREYILDDDDCPLMIEHQYNRSRGNLTFHVRRRPADYQPRKRKKKPKPSKSETDSTYRYEDNSLEKLPYLLELNPDGSEPQTSEKRHTLFLNVTEVGSESSSSTRQYLQLFGPNVQPRHCVIAHTEGIVTVTPTSREAETYVNNMRIYETTILQPGMVVRFGKLHTFRFVDPMHTQKHRMLPDPRQSTEFLDRNTRREDQVSLHHHGSYETTFDADGNVETVSTHSRDDRMSKKSDDGHSHRSLGRESSQGRGSYDKFEPKRGNDPILPAVLEFWEEGEDTFLSAIITQLDHNHVQFKLSPTYVLYMAARFRASTHFRPKSTPSDRAKRLTALMNKIASLIHQVIQDRYRDSSALAFWLANASELLHFLKQDRHLSAYTLDAQDLLAESVQLAFRSLVTCEQAELQSAMPMFLEDRDDLGEEEEGTTVDVLAVLSSAMSLLRCCRVNAALTIQMFSQLFHYINMWLFNKVVCDNQINLCTRLWGARLKRRLNRVETWAEKQGLELAADCHLSRIVQAAHLLQAPKSNSEDFTSISSLCYKLNSLQLKTLFERYQLNCEEHRIPREVIDSVVKVAENTADEQARSEGREIKLEEDTDLQLPFLLPEDGYSCDIVRDVPVGLKDFLEPLVQSGLCRLTIQPTSSGFWTIYMSDQDIGRMPRACSPSVHSNTGDIESNKSWGPSTTQPEVVTISLQKSNNGIGLSIVAAGGMDQDKLGIYVKSVVKGGAADLDGRLQAGDQLLKVDGQSLVGVNQEKAAELMTRTGPVVTLEVAKQGAIYNGLADLLNKPSPIIQRGPRRMSERDIPTRVMNDPAGHEARAPPGNGHSMQPRMQSSKSVPSLNSAHHPEPAPTPVANLRSHEMYNPAYSRTSSTTSIPKAAEFPDNGSRSRSIGNLRQDSATDVKYPYPSAQADQTPPPYPGPPINSGTLNGQPTSHPNLHQHPPPLPQHQPMPQQAVPVVQEERHYQNISMYQQQQQNVYQHARSPSQPCPPRSLHGSQSSLNRTDAQAINSSDRSRPLSTLVSPREQEQYANSLSYAHSPGAGPPPSPKGPVHGVIDPRHVHHPYGQRQLPDHRDFRSAEHLRHGDNERKFHPDSPRSYHEQPVRTHPLHPPPHQQQHSPMGIDPRQRDLLRQEAKMEEMREEVRRREERERMMQQQQQQQHVMGRGYNNWQHARGPNPNIRPPHSYQQGIHQAITTHQPYIGGPPPPAPKPRPIFAAPSERFQRPQRYEHPNMNGIPVYPDGPHAVASSPTSANANMRLSNPPPPVVSYRYGPSGYPPRTVAEEAELKQHARPDPRVASAQGRVMPPHNQNSRVTFELPPGSDPRVQQQLQHDRKESNLTSPSPWEREEKEKIPFHLCSSNITNGVLLHKQLMEEKRRARDMEIRELEGIPYRSAKQEERLRTLRLEQEFQRRAEELPAEDDDDDDDDLMDRADNREQMLKMQEDLERARQRRLQWEQEHVSQNQHPHKQQQHIAQEEWKRQQSQLEEQEGRLRQLRLEEVNRKRELEAARNEEERLLREARRRQDELKAPHTVHPPLPNRPMHLPVNQQNAQSYVSQGSISNYHPSNENEPDIPPPLPTSPPPIEQEYLPVSNQNHVSGHKTNTLSNAHLSSHRSQQMNDNYQGQSNSQLLEPPAPPQRKSSYEVANQLSSPSSLRYSSSAIKNGDGHSSKKVSFHDPRMDRNANCDSNGNSDKGSSQSYTLDDIDEVLATPQNSQNLNMYNPGKTPGVIGAQEVYRDPRQRIEAERTQQESYTSRHAGPEKLTFKEKIKKFAKETGEPETPKDKVKISRAQRDIETNLNGN